MDGELQDGTISQDLSTPFFSQRNNNIDSAANQFSYDDTRKNQNSDPATSAFFYNDRENSSRRNSINFASNYPIAGERFDIYSNNNYDLFCALNETTPHGTPIQNHLFYGFPTNSPCHERECVESPPKRIQKLNLSNSHPLKISTPKINLSAQIDPSLSLPNTQGKNSIKKAFSFGAHNMPSEKQEDNEELPSIRLDKTEKKKKHQPSFTTMDTPPTASRLLAKRLYEIRNMNYHQFGQKQFDSESSELSYSFGENTQLGNSKFNDLKSVEKKIVCNCKNSKCLKLYCECFKAQVECGQGCSCVDCENHEKFEEKKKAAKSSISNRNPNAFKPRVDNIHYPDAIGVQDCDSDNKKQHTQGCNCKKSECIKKYCECYQSDIPCGKNCKCIGCKNLDPKETNFLDESLSKSPDFEYRQNVSSSAKTKCVFYKVYMGSDSMISPNLTQKNLYKPGESSKSVQIPDHFVLKKEASAELVDNRGESKKSMLDCIKSGNPKTEKKGTDPLCSRDVSYHQNVKNYHENSPCIVLKYNKKNHKTEESNNELDQKRTKKSARVIKNSFKTENYVYNY